MHVPRFVVRIVLLYTVNISRVKMNVNPFPRCTDCSTEHGYVYAASEASVFLVCVCITLLLRGVVGWRTVSRSATATQKVRSSIVGRGIRGSISLEEDAAVLRQCDAAWMKDGREENNHNWCAMRTGFPNQLYVNVHHSSSRKIVCRFRFNQLPFCFRPVTHYRA